MASPPTGSRRHRPPEPRVLLVSMPFMSLDLAALSVGVLEAQLRRAGVVCDSAFLGFGFAERIGVDNYRVLATEGNKLGEWVFADALYDGPIVDDDIEAFRDATSAWHGWTDETTGLVQQLKALATEYVEDCLRALPWQNYDLVGFSSTFRQNLASLALGRRVKENHPQVAVAYGGSNWQAGMGEALHECFEWIDYAAIGEADDLIVDLAHAASGRRDARSIPGIVGRDESGRFAGPEPAGFVDMNSLPVPEFTSWLRQRAAHPVVAATPPTLMFESSRGCWWGKRSHCTFCGLNGAAMDSRVRDGTLVFDDLLELRDRHGVDDFLAADTILPIAHFHDLLPALAGVEPQLDIFYELKVNLSVAKVKALADAGVRTVQPGIESLSDNVLKLLRKGTTGLQNVQFLRWCAEFGIEPDWLVLTGIPGETDHDYDEMARLARACRHLPPPDRAQGISIHRFSPLHEQPEAHGYRNLRFDPVYRFLYPFSDEALERIAYHFVAEPVGAAGADAVERGLVALYEWIDDPKPGSLTMRLDGEDLVVDDARSTDPIVSRYRGWQAELLVMLDRVRSRARIGERFASVDTDEIDRLLADLVDRGHVLDGAQGFLALPVWHPARDSVGVERRRLDVVPA